MCRVWRSELCPAGQAHCAWSGHFVAGIPFCNYDLLGSSRWSETMIPTNGRTDDNYPAETGMHATKWPLHAQWACPAGPGFSIELSK
jgi:hypothetical protein